MKVLEGVTTKLEKSEPNWELRIFLTSYVKMCRGSCLSQYAILFFLYSFIHRCIHCLSHLSPSTPYFWLRKACTVQTMRPMTFLEVSGCKWSRINWDPFMHRSLWGSYMSPEKTLRVVAMAPRENAFEQNDYSSSLFICFHVDFSIYYSI
jgi:hypothetical protein